MPRSRPQTRPRSRRSSCGCAYRIDKSVQMCGCGSVSAWLRACGGPIAQWLEQRTHNPLVPGSSPGGPTNLTFSVLRTPRVHRYRGQREVSPEPSSARFSSRAATADRSNPCQRKVMLESAFAPAVIRSSITVPNRSCSRTQSVSVDNEAGELPPSGSCFPFNVTPWAAA